MKRNFDLVVFILVPIILAPVTLAAGFCFGLLGIIFAAFIGGGIAQLINEESGSRTKESILAFFVTLVAVEIGVYFASRTVELDGLKLPDEIMSIGGLATGFVCFSIGWFIAWSCDQGNSHKKSAK